jgi:hypothetical protein
METHLVEARLHASRERLRALLIPDPESGRIEADAFPRSAVMRLVFSTRARRIAMALLSLAMLWRRRGASGTASIWPQLTRSLGSLVGLVRA